MAQWEPRTSPVAERLEALYNAEAERQAEREQIVAEWPNLENREALRRLFKKVTLHWSRTFHQNVENPSRPRKTNRPGRYSYTLQQDQTKWHFTTADLGSSW